MTPNDAVEPVTAAAEPTEYLYFVSFVTAGEFGNLCLPLSFEVVSVTDVDWIRHELRARGLRGAVILSFALLPGGWGE
jgi:hypothetical protein